MERITAVRLCTFVVAFLFVHDLTGAIPRSKKPCSPRCDVASCPSPSCPSGYVPDRCNCCLVCSRAEGDPCGRKNDLPCGDGLECKLPTISPAASGHAAAAGNNKRRSGAKRLCQCKMGQNKVCGSDGKTYSNVCKMQVFSRKALQKGRAAVTLAHKGPCALHADTGHAPLHPNSPRYKFNFIADAVEKIAPAVVHIELFLRHPLFGRHIPLSSGSGFIVTQSGLIVTNAHVVTTASALAGRPQLRVRLHDGDAYEAVVRDVDKKADIATIKVSAQKKLPVLALGHSADLRPGEFVVAIGSPFALQNTVTTGIVSTAHRDGKELGIRDSDMDYVQTDAIINYGNSGGPLVNLDGEVIGINTLKVTAGISFAIPSDRIRRFLNEARSRHSKDQNKLLRGGHYLLPAETQSDAELMGGKKRFIGIRMITITEALLAELRLQNPDFPDVSSGVLVHQVLPDSPAHKGGIRAGDVIVTLNGQTIGRNEDLQGALLGDQPLLLEVRRGDDELLFNIYPHVIVN